MAGLLPLKQKVSSLVTPLLAICSVIVKLKCLSNSLAMWILRFQGMKGHGTTSLKLIILLQCLLF